MWRLPFNRLHEKVFCTHCPSECDVNWSKDLLIKPPVCLLATTPHRWRIDYYSNIRGNSFVMSKGRMPTWVWNKLCLVRETYGAPISQYWSTSSHRRPGSGLASGHIWELISILSNTHSCKQVDFREMARIGITAAVLLPSSMVC